MPVSGFAPQQIADAGRVAPAPGMLCGCVRARKCQCQGGSARRRRHQNVGIDEDTLDTSLRPLLSEVAEDLGLRKPW